MKGLSDELLLDTYQKAVDLKLDKEFLHLLWKEITRRNLTPHKWNKGA